MLTRDASRENLTVRDSTISNFRLNNVLFSRIDETTANQNEDRNFFTPSTADTTTRDDFYRVVRSIHLADDSRPPFKDS